MDTTIIVVTTSNGAEYKVRSPHADMSPRLEESYLWAAQNIVWDHTNNDSDVLELRLPYRRVWVSRRQFASVEVRRLDPAKDKEFFDLL